MKSRVQELAEKLVLLSRKHLGADASFISVSNPDKDDPLKRQPDISKAKSILGFSPDISLDEGLEKTFLDFYRQFQQRSESRTVEAPNFEGFELKAREFFSRANYDVPVFFNHLTKLYSIKIKIVPFVELFYFDAIFFGYTISSISLFDYMKNRFNT